MHLAPSLDTSILTSPLYRRSSSHRTLNLNPPPSETSATSTATTISTSSASSTTFNDISCVDNITSPMPTGAIMLKSKLNPAPVFRGRSPPKYLNRHPVSKRRWRAIGRVVIGTLCVCVLVWMGREGVRCRGDESYNCLPTRPTWLTTPSIPSTSDFRDGAGEWVGGGSVIGKLVGQIPPHDPTHEPTQNTQDGGQAQAPAQDNADQGVLSGMVQDEEGNMQLVEVGEPMQGRDEDEGNVEVWGDVNEENEDEAEFIGGMDIPGF